MEIFLDQQWKIIPKPPVEIFPGQQWKYSQVNSGNIPRSTVEIFLDQL